MTSADLARVEELAALIHPDYPEEAAVFAERLGLFGEGCLVLERQGVVQGYLLSHPWTGAGPPSLNTLLGALPALPSLYYLHDLALAPAMRGSGAAPAAVEAALAVASRHGFGQLALVAVNGADRFWRRSGFTPVDDAALQAAARRYDPQALYMARDVVVSRAK